MTAQLALDLPPLVTVHRDPRLSLDDQFALFHRANPHVADALEALAAQWLARHSRVGVKALIERLRWESGIATDGKPYVLNNNFTSRYARLLISRNPHWRNRIETRALASERAA